MLYKGATLKGRATETPNKYRYQTGMFIIRCVKGHISPRGQMQNVFFKILISVITDVNIINELLI